MPWNDRVKEGAYTSPKGTRLTFLYENVSSQIDKKTTGFEFTDSDGTFVQDLGHSGYRYPLRLFFWGDNYDTEVAEFEALLKERGRGTLEHPIYGEKIVVPFGTITRRDDLVTATNQAVLEVTFWETIDLIYPATQADPAAAALDAVEEFNVAAATDFADNLSLDSAIERVSFKNQVLGLVDSAKSGLQKIADVQADVQNEFNAIVDSVTNGINILVGEPLALAFQLSQMIQAPARALANIDARLTAYNDLATALISGSGADVSGADANASASNKLRTNDLNASSYVTGSIVSVVNNQFETTPAAIEAAEKIIEQFDSVVAWRDENFDTLQSAEPLVDVIDTGGAYQKLQEATAVTVGYLIEISFSLKTEYRVVLDRNRTVIDLVAEFHGAVDSEIDFFITSNDLTGSEILEVPSGREVKYYV